MTTTSNRRRRSSAFLSIGVSPTPDSPITPDDFVMSSREHLVPENGDVLRTRFDAREIVNALIKHDVLVFFDFDVSHSIRVEYVNVDRTRMFRFDEIKDFNVCGEMTVNVSFRSPLSLTYMEMLDHEPAAPVVWALNSHRDVFQFIKSMSTAMKYEKRSLRCWGTYLKVRDVFAPALLTWRHRKPTTRGGVISVTSSKKSKSSMAFAFHMRDADLRSVLYSPPSDDLNLPSALNAYAAVCLSFQRDGVDFDIRLLFKSTTYLNTFLGHCRNVLNRGDVFVDGPYDRWQRRGPFVIMRARIARAWARRVSSRNRNQYDRLGMKTRWLFQTSSSLSRHEARPYHRACAWLLAESPSSVFRNIALFL